MKVTVAHPQATANSRKAWMRGYASHLIGKLVRDAAGNHANRVREHLAKRGADSR